jgi:hypothetical protein
MAHSKQGKEHPKWGALFGLPIRKKLNKFGSLLDFH